MEENMVKSKVVNTGEYVEPKNKKQFVVKVSQDKDKIFEEKTYKNGVVKRSLIGLVKNGFVRWSKSVNKDILSQFKVKIKK